MQDRPADGSTLEHGLDGEIRSVHREIAEVHTVAARTQNALATLGGSLREVIARQDRYERGLNLNSFVAYLLFTLLLGGLFLLQYRSRAERLVTDREQALRSRDTALQEATAVRVKLDAREKAEKSALDFWALIQDGKKAETIAKYSEVSAESLSPVESKVFEQAVNRARVEIVDAGYAEGLESFRASQWKRAGTALKRALVYEEEGPRAAQVRYYYGISLHKQGDYGEASRQLDLAIAGGAERTVGLDARFYLGNALEMLKQDERARVEYEKFATSRPAHPLAPLARRRALALAAIHAPKN